MNELTPEKIEEGIKGILHIGDKQNFNNSSFKIKNFTDREITLFDLWLSHSGFVKYVDPENKMNLLLRNFTKKGRLLKRLGSYAAFVDYKNKQHESVILQAEFIKAQPENIKLQNELTPLLKEANTSTVVTNRILIAVFTLTLVVYIGQLAVSSRPP